MTTDHSTLSLAQMRRVFSRHRGSQAELARDLGVNKVSITQHLKGRIFSQRIADAAQTRALFLLAEEKRQAGSAA